MCLIIKLVFIAAFIYGFKVANGYPIDKPEDENALTNEDDLVYPYGGEVENNMQNNIQNDGELTQYGRNDISKRSPGFTPYISISALSNMHQFFQTLKDNFNSLEKLSDDQARALLGDYRWNGECDPRKWEASAKARKHSYNQDLRVFRPPATAAYLHATRKARPNSRIRSYVANSEPRMLRGTNQYSPSYLWTGLGRRR